MCDTLVAVTEDGVLFAKNSDRDPVEAQAVRAYPAADHPPGAEVRCTWTTIPQVAHTHAVVLSQPWWMWGAEMGANEHGVVIGNEAVFTRRTGAREPGGLLGMDLLRLALERATTRHEAVGVLVALLEEHGQGGSCSHEHPRFTYDSSYLVADPDGATILETAGRRYAADEVRRAYAISNGLTLPGFADRYADRLRGRVAACAVRRERTTTSARTARTPLDLMAALRDHGGQDREGPAYSPLNGALTGPCAHAGGLLTSTQSTASWVADLRPGTPAGGRHWVTGTSAPCTGLFVPVGIAAGLTDTDGLSNRYDVQHLWWRHEPLHRAVVRDEAAAAPYLAERDALERCWTDDPPSTADAVAAGELLRSTWTAKLAAVPDTRPPRVRRQWRGWDRASGLDAVLDASA